MLLAVLLSSSSVGLAQAFARAFGLAVAHAFAHALPHCSPLDLVAEGQPLRHHTKRGCLPDF
jgi:hypothetical protein